MQIKMIRICFHLSKATKIEINVESQFKGGCGEINTVY
jgi:hypothetical protein